MESFYIKNIMFYKTESKFDHIIKFEPISNIYCISYYLNRFYVKEILAILKSKDKKSPAIDNDQNNGIAIICGTRNKNSVFGSSAFLRKDIYRISTNREYLENLLNDNGMFI